MPDDAGADALSQTFGVLGLTVSLPVLISTIRVRSRSTAVILRIDTMCHEGLVSQKVVEVFPSHLQEAKTCLKTITK